MKQSDGSQESNSVTGDSQGTTSPKPAPEHSTLAIKKVEEEFDAEQDALDRAWKGRVDTEIWSFALQRGMDRKRLYKLLLEFAGFALAVTVLFLLSLKPGTDLRSAIEAAGTGLSVVILIATVYVHMAKWDQRIEIQSELHKEYLILREQLRQRSEDPIIDVLALRKLRDDVGALDLRRTEIPLAVVSVSDEQVGYQHACLTFPKAGIRCGRCHRVWQPKYGNQSRLWRLLPCKLCRSCGIKLET